MALLKGIIRPVVIKLFSPSFVDTLRSVRAKLKRLRYNINKRIDKNVVNQADLVMAFKILGLSKNDGIMVYSSMSKFGHIKGGPETIVRAIEEVIGKNGVLAMPAFPIVGNAIEYLKRDIPFDVQKSRSNMGALTEYFRKLDGVYRSIHPTHSICAKGEKAQELVRDHHKCTTAFGPGSPFVRMINQNMYLVSFGVGVHVFTLYHTFEDLCGERYPYQVYLETPFKLRCIDINSEELVVETRIHNPEISAGRIDADPKKEKEVHQLLHLSGKLKSVRLGKGEILAIRAEDLMDELQLMLEKGITIYA